MRTTETPTPPLLQPGDEGDRTALHADGSWGWITWPNRHAPGGHEQHRGGRIALRHGQVQLGTGEIVAADRDTWEREAAQALGRVAPWARALTILSAVPGYEETGRLALANGQRAACRDDGGDDDPDAMDWLNRHATEAELDDARIGGEAAGGLPAAREIRFATLARSIADRYEREADRCRIVAMAAAPADQVDLGHEWVHPDDPDERLDAWVTRQLLAGWRAAVNRRNSLVQGARNSGWTESAISETTGLARTTLARIT
ncbi:hypothetical protein [Streptomyces sp. NPDC001717]|uniref:hypothetical protein n=1 Tax=Streptomyces sp. NPDC001717 TaxID=3364604 RepID=UPI0036B70648